jgi:hypothetical protein
VQDVTSFLKKFEVAGLLIAYSPLALRMPASKPWLQDAT